MRLYYIILLSLSSTLLLSAYQSYDRQARFQNGKKVYMLNCQTCHGEDGKGVPDVFPPLAHSDYLMQDRSRAIRQVLYGARGTMIVNGQSYTGEMPAQSTLNDIEIADVLNYIRNSWGNQDAVVITPQDVKAQRR